MTCNKKLKEWINALGEQKKAINYSGSATRKKAHMTRPLSLALKEERKIQAKENNIRKDGEVGQNKLVKELCLGEMQYIGKRGKK